RRARRVGEHRGTGQDCRPGPGPGQGDVSGTPRTRRGAAPGGCGGRCGGGRATSCRCDFARAGGVGTVCGGAGPMSGLERLIAWNPPLVLAIAALVSVQVIKFVSTLVVKRRLDFERLTGTGGMPSSHAASVAALATAVGL